MRGDFCDRCAAFPELAGALQDGLFVVVPMTESELRVAITGPAETAGLRIDPALTETVSAFLEAGGGVYLCGGLCVDTRLYRRFTPAERRLIARHGSLTSAEMFVPLLVAAG